MKRKGPQTRGNVGVLVEHVICINIAIIYVNLSGGNQLTGKLKKKTKNSGPAVWSCVEKI